METFIRVLPSDYNANFILDGSGAEQYASVATEQHEDGTEYTRYVFFYKDDGNETKLNEAIYNYEDTYSIWARTEFMKQIINRMYTEFLTGFVVPEGKGNLTGHILQVRDTEDRTNWLTSQVAYAAAVQAGAGNMMGATFRTAQNETVTITYMEGMLTLLAMAKWGADIMNRCWVLKDRLLTAQNRFELDAVIADLNNGWPSSTQA